MSPLRSLYDEVIFRLSDISLVELLDLLLVTVVFYLLLSLIQRSRSSSLLRGALMLIVFFFIISVILPLPAFDRLVQIALGATLVATPIIFQPELRRLLERLGRSAGLVRAVRQTTAETLIPTLVRAVENMSDTQTGALIVLEENEPLQDIIETGVPIGGHVTSELLQAIFYPENPLHDGAVVLREDRVVAAGCVLPLTQQSLDFQRRLGTRHRAALGLSELSRALVIIVSEETGTVSVARQGQLQYRLDSAALREQLFDFYVPTHPTVRNTSGWQLLGRAFRAIWRRPTLPTFRQLLSSMASFCFAVLLALVVWTFVIEGIDPSQETLIEEIPLRVENMPPGTTLLTPAPTTVSAIIQGPNSVLNTVSRRSFQASVSLEGVTPGLYHEEVKIGSGASRVRVINVIPPAIDLEVVPIITRTVRVIINLLDAQNISPAYEIVGPPTAAPEQVQVIGPEPVVSRIDHVEATLTVASATTGLREIRPLKAVDENGKEVTGVTLQPGQTQVNQRIRRRLDALDVGVQAIMNGTLPSDYWLSGVTVRPNTVTLRGDQDELAQLGSFINTLPVDVSQARGAINIDVPLDLPPQVQALNGNNNVIRTVNVQVSIDVRHGDLTLTHPVELTRVRPGFTATVTPARLDLLLSGPLPILNEIAAKPDLISVIVDAADLAPGQTAELTPTVVAPEEIRVQLIPSTVLVTLSR